MAPSDKLAILITGQPPPEIAARRGDYGDIIREACGEGGCLPPNIAFICVDVRDAPPPPFGKLSGCIITGSTAQTFEHAPWIERTSAWLKHAVADGLPTLGICFGHQLIAQALGGEVGLHPSGREVGTITVRQHPSAPSQRLLEGLAPEFQAHATHLATVTKLPTDTQVLGTSVHDHHQILAFGERVFGVQFHPEFDRTFMAQYLELRRDRLADEGLDVTALTRNLRDVPAHQVLKNFVTLLR